jgi:hypothetical protein
LALVSRPAAAYHHPVDRYERYTEDALVLGRIGAVLFPQDTRLSVRLPRELAGLARAAWNRDDPQQSGPVNGESLDQRTARERAAYLALIGLCIENTAQPDGDEIICDLDSWYIAGALQAAEALDMLPGTKVIADDRRFLLDKAPVALAA